VNIPSMVPGGFFWPATPGPTPVLSCVGAGRSRTAPVGLPLCVTRGRQGDLAALALLRHPHSPVIHAPSWRWPLRPCRTAAASSHEKTTA